MTLVDVLSPVAILNAISGSGRVAETSDVGYGTGQRNRLVPGLISRIQEGRPVTLREGGRPRMNPIFVEDVAEVFAQALQVPAPPASPTAPNLPEQYKKYDKNGNGRLDQDEIDALRKERQADVLKKYDKNSNGKLDEDEMNAYREDQKKRTEETRAKRKAELEKQQQGKDEKKEEKKEEKK